VIKGKARSVSRLGQAGPGRLGFGTGTVEEEEDDEEEEEGARGIGRADLSAPSGMGRQLSFASQESAFTDSGPPDRGALLFSPAPSDGAGAAATPAQGGSAAAGAEADDDGLPTGPQTASGAASAPLLDGTPSPPAKALWSGPREAADAAAAGPVRRDIRSYFGGGRAPARAAAARREEESDAEDADVSFGSRPRSDDDDDDDDDDGVGAFDMGPSLTEAQADAAVAAARRGEAAPDLGSALLTGGRGPGDGGPSLSQVSFRSLEMGALSQSEAMGRDDLHSDGTRMARVPATADDVRTVTRHVAAGLAHLHARGLAHLDVKPRNVLVSFGRSLCDRAGHLVPAVASLAGLPSADAAAAPDGFRPTFQVADLGRCTRWDDPDARDGDAEYIAPETLNARPGQDRRPADVFALGLIALEMLSAAPLPRRGEGFTELRREHDAARTALRSAHEAWEMRTHGGTAAASSSSSGVAASAEPWPAAVASLVRQMLAVAPGDRPTAAEIAAHPALQPAPSSAPTTPHGAPAAWPDRAPTPWTGSTVRGRRSLGASSSGSSDASPARRAMTASRISFAAAAAASPSDRSSLSPLPDAAAARPGLHAPRHRSAVPTAGVLKRRIGNLG